jgi:para-aminobenzoate synthetase/4-amino-4-deoxychorismate lyase
VIDARFPATLQVGRNQWLSFDDPVLVLQADSPDAVRRTITDVEHLTRDRGLHAVGFVTYEAAAAFGLPAHSGSAELPLAWFGLYEPAQVRAVDRPRRASPYALGPLEASVDRDAFSRAFGRIRDALASGNSYQANYTFRLTGRFEGDAYGFFADLAEAQQGEYSAFIDLGDQVICSASPELFFEFRGADLVMKPMKGTAQRGRTIAEDRAAGLALAESRKDRAENVMIVDMIRNDIGRVADVGSVHVPALFSVERYPNVWQMTSTVIGRSIAPLDEVFAALHPSASVTGAPRVSTMRLLADLETTPRGVYTGAIGHVPPDGLARFNVAIRTAIIDRPAGRLTFGVGSGIVWDSEPMAEYDECLLKASVLVRRPVDFELLETLRWTPGEGFFLLAEHMDRLQGSAEYFDVPVSLAEIESHLNAGVAGASTAQRVRLLVSRSGEIRIEPQPYVPRPQPLQLRLAASPVDRSDVFLYHKTTNRGVYERAQSAQPDCDDVLLWNEHEQVTESTTANLVAEIDGVRVTPPVSCGLLAGTCRAAMLATGEIAERIVTLDELQRATRLWLINAVHGEMAAKLRT